MVDEAETLAAELWRQAREEEQSARVVPDDALAARVRSRVRELAATAGIRIRTARSADAVVVVRLDAAVWHEDAATMRRKLSPPRS